MGTLLSFKTVLKILKIPTVCLITDKLHALKTLMGPGEECYEKQMFYYNRINITKAFNKYLWFNKVKTSVSYMI